MDDPRPLIESDTGDPLARLMQHAREMPIDFDLSRALVRHEQLVAKGVPPLVVTRGPWLRWAWWGCAVVVIGCAALLVGRSIRDEPASSPMARSFAATVVVEPRAAVQDAVTMVAAPPSAQRADVSHAPERAPAKLRVQPPSATVSRRAEPTAAAISEPENDDRIAREAAHVRRIRELLDGGDAKAALSTCEDGDREFEHGVFALERDGLRTLAALTLDRAGAVDDANAYLERHPRAPLAGRIFAALGER